LVTYLGGIPAQRRSPIPVLAGLNVEQLRSSDDDAITTLNRQPVLIAQAVFIFCRASRTLRDATQVVTFLSVRDKKMSGRTEKVTLFNAFLQAGLTDLDKIWHDGRS